MKLVRYCTAAGIAVAACAAVACSSAEAAPIHSRVEVVVHHSPATGGWVYTESNNATPGKNSVLALHYGASGALSPIQVTEFPTSGTGAPFILGQSTGTLDGDHEVFLSGNHKWLFAVNEGSNTIAVFKVDTTTGALTAVAGSPFPSGGIAPISVTFNNGRLVVANHGQIAPFNVMGTTPPGLASFVSFKVSSAGALTKVSTIPEGPSGLIDATLSPSGNNLVSSGFYSQNIYSLTLSSSGALTEAAGSPTKFPASMLTGVTLPPFLPTSLIPLPFGVTFNPTNPYVYIVGPANLRVAIYRYTTSGTLTFAGQAENPGGVAACWDIVSANGKWLYTGNSFSQDVSLFDVGPGGSSLTFVKRTSLPSMGTDGEMALSPDGKTLYVIGVHDDPDAPRPQGVLPSGAIVDAPTNGNFIDAFRVAGDGELTAISSTALPVRFDSKPFGLATLAAGS